MVVLDLPGKSNIITGALQREAGGPEAGEVTTEAEVRAALPSGQD